VHIIIPVHNRKEFTRNCLLSLRSQTVRNFIVVVIDDGSSDGTSEMIQREFPEVILIQGDGNLWWTGATNLGVRYALEHDAEYVMTLNNDTAAAGDFVEKMMVWAKMEPKALLGALAIDARSQVPIYGGEIIDWKLARYKRVLDTLEEDDQKGLHEVTHFPGRGLLIPSEVFSRIGLFDEKLFPHYAADYDFTHRAIRAGYRVFCNYDAKIYIYPNASGDVELRKKKTIKNYYNHLFAMKGGGNLEIFWRYALRNCPRNYLPSFLFFGISRRIFGYLIEWMKEYFKK
jgi:GT2 family glycosyltransferase